MGVRSENGVIHYPQTEENIDSDELQKNLNAEIKIILNNEKEDGVRPFYIIDNEMDEINIRTIINPSGAVKYFVNGRNWKKKALREALSNCSINPDNPFLFLEQNKTISLLERGPIGLLEALEDILDIKEIRDNLDNAQESYYDSQKSYDQLYGEMNKLKLEVDNLKKEYDKDKKFQELNLKIKQLQDEVVSSQYKNICREVRENEKSIEETTYKFNKIKIKNKELSESLDLLLNSLQQMENHNIELRNNEKEFNKQLFKIENNLERETKSFRDYSKQLEEINRLKKIDPEQIIRKKENLEEQYLTLNTKIEKKKDLMKSFDRDLKILEKGKSIGPEESQKFLKILEKKGIKSDLLINALSLNKAINLTLPQSEDIRMFESNINTFRWTIVVYGTQDEFQEAIDLAKNNHFNDFLIHQDIQKVGYQSNLQFHNISFKTKSYSVMKFLENVINDFNNQDIKLDEGIINYHNSVKYFLLNPLTLTINREDLINRLKINKKTCRNEINELTKEFKGIKRTIEDISKQINQLEAIKEESNLKLKISDSLKLQKELDEQIKTLQLEISNLKGEIDKSDKIIKNLTEEKAKKELLLEQNSELVKSFFNKLNQFQKDFTNLNNKKEQLEKEKKDLILKFLEPREINILKEFLSELNIELKEIGIINYDAVKEYELKNDAYHTILKKLLKADEDLNNKIIYLKKYQIEFKEFIEKILKDIQKNFSKILRGIDYDGKVLRKLYRFEDRKRVLKVIEETPDIIMDNDTFYGIDIRMKKPGDKNFLKFFNSKGKVSSRHSGGQKALIMLAYLLAIQKTLKISTNFYVLDEPTPTLDPLNNSFILKLFSEMDVQIILLTPNPIPPEFFDEIIAIIDKKISKISSELYNKLLLSEEEDIDYYLMIKRNGDSI